MWGIRNLEPNAPEPLFAKRGYPMKHSSLYNLQGVFVLVSASPAGRGSLVNLLSRLNYVEVAIETI
jgi:hypothetical protein